MKLQQKLTLWFSVLLLLVYVAMLLALHMVSGAATRATAKTTLEDAVSRYVSQIGYDHGRPRDFKGRTYDDGAYLQVYSPDGSALLTGPDVFGVSAMAPALIAGQAEGEVFRLDAEQAGLYCYLIHLEADGDLRLRGGRTSQEPAAADGTETGASTEPASAEPTDDLADDGFDGVWVLGLLPEDSMENVTGSVERAAVVGLAPIVLLAVLGGMSIAGRALRPLRKITESAREISDGHDLSRRIELEPGRDEVHELADTFNDMMGRLEQSFEAERQFTSDASHELRTPTTVILAECEMAEKTPDDPAALLESVTEVHRQAKKMSDLIGRLLSYTRLEQGTRRIDREPLDLSELAAEICEEQRTAAGRDIAIACDAAPEVTVLGDVSLLIILIQNLISNAVKYGRDGGHVWVAVRGEDGRAVLTVRDDGIGIAPEDLDRIWNRFYQADRSRSDESRGVGLGLSLARQIARLHGGALTAESEPGQGSTFTFTMPLA